PGSLTIVQYSCADHMRVREYADVLVPIVITTKVAPGILIPSAQRLTDASCHDKVPGDIELVKLLRVRPEADHAWRLCKLAFINAPPQCRTEGHLRTRRCRPYPAFRYCSVRKQWRSILK